MGKAAIATMIGLGLALGACGGDAPEQSNTTTMRAANPTSDGLKTLSPVYRFLGLRRAIVESGQRCKKVDNGAYQEEYKSMAMWVAHCTDSGDWLVFIAPTGDVQVRQCRHAPTLGLPTCKPLPAAPAMPEEKAAPAKKS
jgi:hypothetical protein